MNCQRCGYNTGTELALYCPLCGGLITHSQMETKVKDEIPWEKSSANAPLNALIDTLQQSFFKTNTFFKNLKNVKKNKNALYYALVTGSFGLIASFVWSYFLKDTYVNIDTEEQSYVSYIISPLFILLQILLSSVYVHFMLFISRTKKESFQSTLRIVCYSEGAMILNALPYLGSLVSTIAWLYFVVTGINQVHGASKWRSFFVLLLPFIILISLFFLILLIVVIAGVSTGTDSSSFLQKFLEH